MSNERLNNPLLCHVHKELLNEVDDDSVMRTFIMQFEWRISMFK